MTAIEAGTLHALALKGDAVIAWGTNQFGESTVPADARSGVSAIAASYFYSMALKGGRVIFWGDNRTGQRTVPPDAQSGVSAIAAGNNVSLALKGGRVVAWGDNAYGQTNVPAEAQSGVTAIAAGYAHALALKDGRVIAWGNNGFGQATVPVEAQSGVVAISATYQDSMALTSTGKVLVWGDNTYGQRTVPAQAQAGVTAISAGTQHALALRGTPAAPAKPTITSVASGARDGEAVVSFLPGAVGYPPAEPSFTVTGTPDGGGRAVTTAASSGSPVRVTGLTNGTAYRFTVTATNEAGSSTSDSVGPAQIGVAPTIGGTPPGGTLGAAYRYAYTLTGLPAPTTTVTGGALPAGLTLSSAGVLSGTPTATGTFTFTVTAANVIFSPAQTNTVTISPAPARPGKPTITSVTPSRGQAIVAFTPGAVGYPTATTYTVTATPEGGGQAVTVPAPFGSPETVSGLSNGTTYRFTVTATNAAGSTTSDATDPVLVGYAPLINGTPPDGIVDAPYSYAYTVTGMPAPTTSVTSGKLPSGLTLNSGGVLSGTPTADGSSTFTVSASNAFGRASLTSTVTVKPAPVRPGKPTITSVAPGDGLMRVGFTAGAVGYPTATTFTATANPEGGGPAVTVAAPSGSPVTVTGLTNGTSYRFTVTATNAAGSTTSDTTDPFPVGVAPTIAGTPPRGTVGVAYRFDYTLTGLPAPTTTVTRGTLPAGLSLSAGGVLSGTPTEAGSSTFTVTATNAIDRLSRVSTVTVNPAPAAPGKPSVTSVTPGDGQARVGFTAGAEGYPAETTFTATATPEGGAPAVSVSAPSGSPVAVTGLSNGTTYRFTVTATNATGSTTSDPTDPVVIGVAPAVTGTPLDGEVDAPYSYAFALTGLPAPTTAVTNGALPAGLSLSAGGVLSGTPTSAGGFTFTVTAANAVDRASITRTVTVSPAPALPGKPTVTSVKPDDGQARVAFTPGAVGYPTATAYTVNAAPVGGGPVVTVDAASGSPVTVSGLTNGTSYRFTVTATNSTGSTTSDASDPVVVGVAPTITGAPGDGVVDGSYSYAYTLTGLPTPTVSVTGGSLPAGLSLSADGVLSGTPTVAGTSTFTVSAANAVDTVSVRSTVTVAPLSQQVEFTSSPPSPAVVGGKYELAASGGGSGLPVTFTVDPATTNRACTVNGATVSFVEPGRCVIAANQAGNSRYSAAATVTQAVEVTAKTAQQISITSPAPVGAVVTDTYQVAAVGGGSGQPVVFSSLTPEVCTVDGDRVLFVGAGTCTVAADQAGTAVFSAAPEATQDIEVARIGATVTLTPPAGRVYGQPVQVTASIIPAKGAAVGVVQFAVDGTDVGSPVPVTAGGTATSPPLTAAGGGSVVAGSHPVTATFVPTDPVVSAPASGSGVVVVDQARTTTRLQAASGALTATVSPVGPGAGTPTGTVTFTVDGQPFGSATLAGGVATLTRTVPAGMVRHLAATYPGDPNFVASSDSTVRNDPTITATVASPTPKSKAGWYRSPVTVRFTCTPAGAPLTTACPTPVVLTADKAGQSVSRTIAATDGGVATVTVVGIDIDRTAPTVTIGGLQPHYPAGRVPDLRCRATDRLSGVATCRLTVTSTTTAEAITLAATATATDRANNTTTTKARVSIPRYGLDNVAFTDGAYNVRHGKTYLLVALSDDRPHLQYAAPTPRKPAGGNDPFHRAGRVGSLDRWVLGITLGRRMNSHHCWNLGIKEGKTTHTLKLRVS